MSLRNCVFSWFWLRISQTCCQANSLILFYVPKCLTYLLLKVFLCLTLWAAKQCPIGLQYQECISCCPETCSLERSCIDSKLACLDGCYCPEGDASLSKNLSNFWFSLIGFRRVADALLVCVLFCSGLIFEGGACVTPSDCPCEHRGSLYQSGQTLQEECNNWWATCSVVSGIILHCFQPFWFPLKSPTSIIDCLFIIN